MPKVKKARARRHAAAVLTAKEQEVEAQKRREEKEAVTTAFGTFEVSKASATEATAPSTATPAATTLKSKAAKKATTKKQKRTEKHKAFMSKLLLPGDNTKFASTSDASLSLSNLTSSLPSATAVKEQKEQQKSTKISAKARKNIARQEIAHFTQVLAHPAFQSNPLQAIRQHIQNTQGLEAVKDSQQRAQERLEMKMEKVLADQTKATLKTSQPTKSQKKHAKRAQSRKGKSHKGSSSGGDLDMSGMDFGL